MARLLISIVSFVLLLIFIQSCKPFSKIFTANNHDTMPSGIMSFLSTRDGNFEIYSMTVDGTNVKNLTNNESLDFSSNWSPDGNHILFYSNRDGNNEIYRMDADGKNPVNISNHTSNDFCLHGLLMESK